MKPITCRSYGSYTVGSSITLTDIQVEKMLTCFTSSAPASGRGLEGRTSVTRINLDGIGPVVIKRYMRGGFLEKFNRDVYLNTGKPRPEIEYEQLLKARSAGINAPEPVCFATRGMLFYRAWLVTREIERPQSLARLSMKDMASALSKVKTLTPQILSLLDNRIFHKDLHPGNVLIDKNNTVFIIDFDKACVFQGDKRTLLKKYLQRWGRAVTKHGLPEALYDALRKELMK